MSNLNDEYVLLTERTFNEMYADIKRLKATPKASPTEFFTTPQTYFVNKSAYEIPAYGAFQVSGIEKIQNVNYLKAVRGNDFTAAQSIICFNGHQKVSPGDLGTIQSGPVYRAIASGTAGVGDRLGLAGGSFEVSLGAILIHLGEDDIETNCIRVAFDYSAILFEAAGAIAVGAYGTIHRLKRSGTNTWTKDTTRSYVGHNTLGSDIAAGTKGKAWPVDGVWSIVEIC